MKDVQFVGFDYNGTLVDDVELALASCNYILKKVYNAPKISLERFKTTFRTPWKGFYGENGVPIERIKIEQHQREYQKIDKKNRANKLYLHAGVEDTLAFLKDRGLTLAVLSSRNIDSLMIELTSLGIIEYFDTVIGEDNIHQDGIRAGKKTERLIQQLKINSNSSVLYIGDMAQDIRLAKQYGFKSGAFPHGWQIRERVLTENPDYVFESFAEIKELFSQGDIGKY